MNFTKIQIIDLNTFLEQTIVLFIHILLQIAEKHQYLKKHYLFMEHLLLTYERKKNTSWLLFTLFLTIRYLIFQYITFLFKDLSDRSPPMPWRPESFIFLLSQSLYRVVKWNLIFFFNFARLRHVTHKKYEEDVILYSHEKMSALSVHLCTCTKRLIKEFNKFTGNQNTPRPFGVLRDRPQVLYIFGKLVNRAIR